MRRLPAQAPGNLPRKCGLTLPGWASSPENAEYMEQISGAWLPDKQHTVAPIMGSNPQRANMPIYVSMMD